MTVIDVVSGCYVINYLKFSWKKYKHYSLWILKSVESGNLVELIMESVEWRECCEGVGECGMVRSARGQTWHYGVLMVCGAWAMVMPELAGLCCMFLHCCTDMLPDCGVSTSTQQFSYLADPNQIKASLFKMFKNDISYTHNHSKLEFLNNNNVKIRINILTKLLFRDYFNMDLLAKCYSL